VRWEPHEYQTRALRHLLDNPRAALWLDMGLGKTVVTLTAVRELLDALYVGKVLVVAPLRVALTTWPTEIAKWDHTRHLTYQVLRGTPKRRLQMLRDLPDITLVNYEQLQWLATVHRDTWPFDLGIFDESSKMKSSSSKRWRAVRKVLRYMDRVVLLTGTPAPNGLVDLWAQMYLLDFGRRLGATKTAFLDRWFQSDYMGWKWTAREGADAEIHARLADVCLSMRAADYLTLPPVLYNVVPVLLDDAVQADYDELEREMLLEVAREGRAITAVNGAVLSMRLLQLVNGAVYLTDDDGNQNGEWEDIHDAKLDALADVLDEAGGPVLLAYEYRCDLARILDRFPQARALDQDPNTVAAWNRGEIPLLVAHPASAGHGLNLQQGGSTVVWYGPTWNLEHYQQFNARLARQGQERPVIVHHLIAQGTIEERVLDVMQGKATVQEALLQAVRDAA
jgi:SNF2 family DNA or RNA helicase